MLSMATRYKVLVRVVEDMPGNNVETSHATGKRETGENANH